MIRNLLATTAIATLLIGGAAAQTPPPMDAPAPTSDTPMIVHAEGHLASNLIGESAYNGTGADAENIGQVVDLVISDDGNVEAIVVGVGGFLGIGQKEVALEYDLVEWAEQPEGERRLVVPASREALESLPDFDRSAFRPMPADSEVGQTTPATRSDLDAAPTESEDASSDDAAPGTDTAVTPVPVTPPATTDDAETDSTTQMTDTDTTESDGGAVDRSTLTEVPIAEISADNLIGTTVYGADDENIGEINDAILSDDGEVDAIIVDVGGFLGVGAKAVAVGMDNLVFLADEDGDRYLYTEFTKEQLEAQPEYDEATYPEQRDQMRMNLQ